MVKVRRAKEEDIPAVVGLCRMNWEENTKTGKMGLPFNEGMAGHMVAAVREHGILQVADVDDKVVGAIGMAVGPIPFSGDGLMANEVGFHVLPDYRDKGVGQQLLKQAEHIAKQMGVKLVCMIHAAGAGAERAENVYEKMNYSPAEMTYIKEL